MKLVCVVLFSLVVCIAADGPTPYLEGMKCSDEFIKAAKKQNTACRDEMKAKWKKGVASLFNENPVFARFQRDADDDEATADEEAAAGDEAAAFAAPSEGGQGSQGGHKRGKHPCQIKAAMRELAMCTVIPLLDLDEYKTTLTAYCSQTRTPDLQESCLHKQVFECTGLSQEMKDKFNKCGKEGKEKETTPAN